MKKNMVVAAIVPVLLFAAAQAQAAGVSPAQVTVANILKGTTQTKSVTLSRDAGTTGDIRLTVAAQGDYAGAVSVPASVTIPAGVSSVSVPVVVDATTLPTGNTVVPIYATEVSSSTTTAANTNAVVKAVRFTTSVNVSDQPVVNYVLSDVALKGTKLSSPLSLSFYVSNRGNVAWKPTKVSLSLNNIYSWVSTQNYSFDIPGSSLPTIAPGAVTQVTVSVPQNFPTLSVNSYKGNVAFYDTALVQTLPTQTVALGL